MTLLIVSGGAKVREVATASGQELRTCTHNAGPPRATVPRCKQCLVHGQTSSVQLVAQFHQNCCGLSGCKKIDIPRSAETLLLLFENLFHHDDDWLFFSGFNFAKLKGPHVMPQLARCLCPGLVTLVAAAPDAQLCHTRAMRKKASV